MSEHADPALVKSALDDDDGLLDDAQDPFLAELAARRHEQQQKAEEEKEGGSEGATTTAGAGGDAEGALYACVERLENTLGRGARRVASVSIQRLEGVSAQITEAGARREVGLPTSLAVSRFIAVGTSHGLILVFDTQTETLRLILGLTSGTSTSSITSNLTSSLSNSLSSIFAAPRGSTAAISPLGSGVVGSSGAVTALDAPPTSRTGGNSSGNNNSDGGAAKDTWLLAGYQNGDVVLWDVESGKALRALAQAHTAPVTAVRWLHDARAVSTGALGTALVHAFTPGHILGVRETRAELVPPVLLASASVCGAHAPPRGRTLLAVAPLLPFTPVAHIHPADALGLVACATARRAFVVAVLPGSLTVVPCRALLPVAAPTLTRDQLRGVEEQGAPSSPSPSAPSSGSGSGSGSSSGDGSNASPLPPQGDPVPYLAWRPAMPTAEQSKVLDPIVAVGWGRQLSLLQVAVDPAARAGGAERVVRALEFVLVSQFDVASEIAGLAWCGAQTLVYTTAQNALHVVDPFLQQEIDARDVRFMQLLYHTCFVSPVTGNTMLAYHGALRRHRARLYTVGREGVFRTQLLSWDVAIQVLVDRGLWRDALALLLAIYRGTAGLSVGLPANPDDVRTVARAKLLDVLRKYVCLKLSGTPSSSSSSSSTSSSSEATAPSTKEKEDNNNNNNNNNNYDAELVATCVFCAVRVAQPAFVFDELYPLLAQTGRAAVFFDALEPFVVQQRLAAVPPALLTALVQHLVAHGRRGAAQQCLLGAAAASIELAPVVRLCQQQRFFAPFLHVYAEATGNYAAALDSILAYVVGSTASATASATAPWQPAPDRRDTAADLLAFLDCALHACTYPQRRPLGDPARARTVLADLAQYLLAPAAAAPAASPDPHPHPHLFYLLSIDTAACLRALEGLFEQVPVLFRDAPATAPDLGAVLCGLFDVAVSPLGTDKGAPWRFSRADEGRVLHFVAQRLVGADADAALAVPSAVVERAMRFVAAPADSKEACADHAALALGLLQRAAARTDAAGVRLAAALRDTCVAQGECGAAEWAYTQQRLFGAALRCRVRDARAARRASALDLAAQRLADPALSAAEQADVRAALEECVPALVAADAPRTHALLVGTLRAAPATVAARLAAHPAALFAYLDAAFAPAGKAVAAGADAALPPELHAQYLELLCARAPERVCAYLAACDDCPLDVALRVCQRAGVRDATVLLLERVGDIHGALTLLLQDVAAAVAALARACAGVDHTGAEGGAETTTVAAKAAADSAEGAARAAVDRCVAVCVRNSANMKDGDCETLWFLLLDALVMPLRAARAARPDVEHYRQQQLGLAQDPRTRALSRRTSTLRRRVRMDSRLGDSLSPSSSSPSSSSGRTAEEQNNNSSDGAQAQGEVAAPQATRYETVLSGLAETVLGSMTGSVSMPHILRRILDEHGADELGSFKTVLIGMLDTFAFERRIQETTAHLLQQDVFSSTATFLHKKQRAFERPRAPATCAMCGLALYAGDVRDAAAASVVFFRCAHAYHRRCCDRAACAICTARRATLLRARRLTPQQQQQQHAQQHAQQQGREYAFSAAAGAGAAAATTTTTTPRGDTGVVKEEDENPFGDSGRAAPAFRTRQTAMEQRLCALDTRLVRADTPYHGTTSSVGGATTPGDAPHRAHPLLAPGAMLPAEPVVCARLEGFSLAAARGDTVWS